MRSDSFIQRLSNRIQILHLLEILLHTFSLQELCSLFAPHQVILSFLLEIIMDNLGLLGLSHRLLVQVDYLLLVGIHLVLALDELLLDGGQMVSVNLHVQLLPVHGLDPVGENLLQGIQSPVLEDHSTSSWSQGFSGLQRVPL